MNEYQYYEFLALDRALTSSEREELRQLSTRAEITATRFTNEYQWGSFRGDPEKMMASYFDAFLFLANWGTRHLMFRIPRIALDAEYAGQYCYTGAASLIETDDSSGTTWTTRTPSRRFRPASRASAARSRPSWTSWRSTRTLSQ